MSTSAERQGKYLPWWKTIHLEVYDWQSPSAHVTLKHKPDELSDSVDPARHVLTLELNDNPRGSDLEILSRELKSNRDWAWLVRETDFAQSNPEKLRERFELSAARFTKAGTLALFCAFSLLAQTPAPGPGPRFDLRSPKGIDFVLRNSPTSRKYLIETCPGESRSSITTTTACWTFSS